MKRLLMSDGSLKEFASEADMMKETGFDILKGTGALHLCQSDAMQDHAERMEPFEGEA